MSQYRDLLARDGIIAWSVVRLVTRFPAAAAPIMFVMLSRAERGEYSTGAWMAAACVFTECIAAPVLGSRADRKPVAPDARLSLAVSGAALITLSAGITVIPLALLIVLAGIMGGSIAGLIGGLRVVLTRLLDEESVHIGLSWDSVITTLTFAISPLLVTSLALAGDGRLPLVLTAIGCGFAILWLGRIPGISQPPAAEPISPQQPCREHPWRVLARPWPIYLTSAAAMFLSGAIEISVTPLLEASGYNIQWAGVALSLFSVAAIAGGAIYGLRKWPGSYPAQCLAFLMLTSLLVGISAIGHSWIGLAGILVPLAGAGIAQTCLVTARNISLHQSLPGRQLSAGNSVLYSASCIGFGLSSAAAGWFADRGVVVEFILISAAIAAILGLLSAAAERTQQSRRSRKHQVVDTGDSAPQTGA